MSAKVRKYIVGERLNLLDAISEVVAGNYLFCNHKPTHPSWCLGWQLNTFRGFADHGSLKRAIINPEWKPKEQEPEDE
jgi:hypothetical protein